MMNDRYIPSDIVAFLKSLPKKERVCRRCRSDNWSVSVAKGTHSYPFFSVTCNECGTAGLYNAAELIGKFGEWE